MTENKKAFCLENRNVSSVAYKKMGLTYIPWGYVIDIVKKLDDNAHYLVKTFDEFDLKTRKVTGRKVNYHMDINGTDSYVEVIAYFRGKRHTQRLYCYDYRGNSVQVPSGKLVNKTTQRCLVKAFAVLTGLGLSLYQNGSTTGDDQNVHHTNSNGGYRNYSNGNRGYSNSNHGQYSNARNKESYKKEPQEWVLKSIQKQLNTKYDRNIKPKFFKSLYDTRNDLQPAINQVANMAHCSPAAAAYDIGKKYLAKLPNKSDESKHQSSDSAVDKTKPATTVNNIR